MKQIIAGCSGAATGKSYRNKHRFGGLSFSVLAWTAITVAAPVEKVHADAGYSRATLEEIVVTARKWKESMQDAPVAVSVFSSDDMEKKGLDNLMDVGAFSPNVSMSSAQSGSGGSNNGQIYIRGIGQNDFLFTTDPGVGIYIDGVFHPRTLGASMDLLDLERVEVLRGPQGTLFGKNTVGGAINVVSAKPGTQFSGYLHGNLGSDGRRNLRGSVNLPLMREQLYARLSFVSKNRDGWGERLDFADNSKIDETGDEDQRGVRLSLRWLANDNVTLDVAGDYSHWDQQSAPTTAIGTAENAGGVPIMLWNALVGIPGGTPYDSRYVIDDPDKTYGDGPNGNLLEAWGISATLEWNMQWATFKSITAYREMTAEFGRDGDGSPLPIVHTNQDQEQDQFSQELQLSGLSWNDRLQWVAGVFYFEEFGRDQNDVVLTSGLFSALESLPVQLSGAPCAPPFVAPGCSGNPINPLLDLDFDIFNEIDITSSAAYSQGTFSLTDALSLNLGARITYEKKEYFLEHRRVASNTFIVPATAVEESWTEPTYMAGLQYRFSDRLMIYFTYSIGFKSGGFNGRPTVSQAVSAFDPEFLDSFELGLKSEWFDNRLRLNAATFYYDYDDLQFTATSADPDSGAFISVIDNVAAATVQGLELELQALPLEGLNISATLGYTDFEISDLDPLVVDVTPGTQNIRTPRWTASASIEYSFILPEKGGVKMRGDWSYQGKSYADIQNTPKLAQDSHIFFNARLSWASPDSAWELALYGTNLTDKRVIVSGLQTVDSFGTVEGIYNRPREWGASVKWSF